MIGELSDRLVKFLKAADDLRKAEDKVEYDRGYFLHREREYLKDMEEQFVECLWRKLANYKPKGITNEGSQAGSDPEVLRG